MNRLYALIRNYAPLTTLSALVADVERAAHNLEVAAQRHYERAEYHGELSMRHDAKAAYSETEGDRAMHIAGRVRDLLK